MDDLCLHLASWPHKLINCGVSVCVSVTVFVVFLGGVDSDLAIKSRAQPVCDSQIVLKYMCSHTCTHIHTHTHTLVVH